MHCLRSKTQRGIWDETARVLFLAFNSVSGNLNSLIPTINSLIYGEVD
jgi:hypothetical protein